MRAKRHDPMSGLPQASVVVTACAGEFWIVRRRNDRDDDEQDKRILGRGGEPDGQCGGICWDLAVYAAYSG